MRTEIPDIFGVQKNYFCKISCIFADKIVLTSGRQPLVMSSVCSAQGCGQVCIAEYWNNLAGLYQAIFG